MDSIIKAATDIQLRFYVMSEVYLKLYVLSRFIQFTTFINSFCSNYFSAKLINIKIDIVFVYCLIHMTFAMEQQFVIKFCN